MCGYRSAFGDVLFFREFEVAKGFHQEGAPGHEMEIAQKVRQELVRSGPV